MSEMMNETSFSDRCEIDRHRSSGDLHAHQRTSACSNSYRSLRTPNFSMYIIDGANRVRLPGANQQAYISVSGLFSQELHTSAISNGSKNVIDHVGLRLVDTDQ